ncbi:MAG TPA: hypothetical protein VMQ81_08540, partial [Acidimicrobiia bacterium]|nr:hypothetical protein [Acidimicrobiia bacterium]
LFEGNAQSFRVVTYLEPKYHGFTKTGRAARSVGLDLTRATLRALMKYPLVEGSAAANDNDDKFGVHNDPDDLAYFDWVWDGEPPKEAVLSAKIMNRADDIAYAVHDFEDGVWGGMIPLHELLTSNSRVIGKLQEHFQRRKSPLFPNDEAVAATIASLFTSKRLDYLRDGPFERTRYHRAALKNFTAELIGEFIGASTSGGRLVDLRDPLARRLKLLKEMAWLWMIERSDIATFRFGQRRLIERIYDGYWDTPTMLPHQDEWRLIAQTEPKSARSWRRREQTPRWPEKARFIRDHVAGMTDGYAREVYDQMYRARQRRDLRLAY